LPASAAGVRARFDAVPFDMGHQPVADFLRTSFIGVSEVLRGLPGFFFGRRVPGKNIFEKKWEKG
jgi:hypothetical protein